MTMTSFTLSLFTNATFHGLGPTGMDLGGNPHRPTPRLGPPPYPYPYPGPMYVECRAQGPATPHSRAYLRQ
eukprot:scaffold7576_cov114-Isochrysis_galbana.AAC.3